MGLLQGGPQSVEDYGKLWSSLSKVFPNAEIVASTFDNYTQAERSLLRLGLRLRMSLESNDRADREVLAAKREALPRVSKEVGE